MLWIKRNLFLAVGGLIFLVLLGWGLLYMMSNIKKSNAIEEELEAKKAALNALYNQNIFPGKTNIDIARADIKRLREAVTNAKRFFAPLPFENVRDRDFRALLDNTIAELQRRAQDASVDLPSKNYSFSFEAQKKLLTFAEGSFPALPEQLAEIKAICSILIDAKVNRLISLKRPRLTTDDPPNLPDYHELRITTNALTGSSITPYQLEFSSFSGELATVLETISKSSNGLVVKAMTTEPLPLKPAQPGALIPPPAQPPPAVALPPLRPGAPGAPAVRQFPPPGVKPGGAAAAQDQLKTVLDEELLKVGLYIEVVKARS
jgi:hypothetical protein